MTRRKKLIPIIIMLVMTIVTAFILHSCDAQSTDTFMVKISGKWFTLETAITNEKQKLGLGFRDFIDDDGGMIFINDTDEARRFWMIDCLIDMDIIYVDKSGYIVSCYTMKAVPLQQPDETRLQYEARVNRDASYPSLGKARYIIELKAGKNKELDLKRGNKLDLDLNRLKELAKLADGG